MSLTKLNPPQLKHVGKNLFSYLEKAKPAIDGTLRCGYPLSTQMVKKPLKASPTRWRIRGSAEFWFGRIRPNSAVLGFLEMDKILFRKSALFIAKKSIVLLSK